MKKLILFLLLVPFVAAQVHEPILGLDQNSIEYQQYTGCVDQCAKCETRCKDGTVQEAARSKLDVNLCNQLSEESLKTSCLDNVNNVLAITNKDTSYCDKLFDPLNVDGCKQSILNAKALEAKDASLCPTDSCRYAVYATLAAQNRDASLCENIADELARLNCKNSVIPEVAGPQPQGETMSGEQKKLPLNLLFAIGGGVLGFTLVLVVSLLLLRRKKNPGNVEEEAFKQRFTQLSQAQPKMPQQPGAMKK